MPRLVISSPIGPLALREEQSALVEIAFCGSPDRDETPLLLEAARQLTEYFAGARRRFDLPLAPRGTAFQRAVWQALLEIPYGQTRSYADIARAVGRPLAFRAVGAANHANPLPLVIPCHRVIGRNGRLTGYAGGLDVKENLLRLEQEHGGINP